MTDPQPVTIRYPSGATETIRPRPAPQAKNATPVPVIVDGIATLANPQTGPTPRLAAAKARLTRPPRPAPAPAAPAPPAPAATEVVMFDDGRLREIRANGDDLSPGQRKAYTADQPIPVEPADSSRRRTNLRGR